MKVVAAVFASLVLGSAVFAQSHMNFDFGARAGVPVTKPLAESFTGLSNGVPCCGRRTDSVARTFIVGPALGVTFLDRVRVEFDALHRPLRSVVEITMGLSPPITPSMTYRISGAVWDLPVMANYRFFSGAVRPYAGPGFVLVTLVSGTAQDTFFTGRGPSVFVGKFSDRDWFPAYGAQAGLEWKRGHFVIRPEVRYSHSGQMFFIQNGVLRDKNQLDFLVGFAFEPYKPN